MLLRYGWSQNGVLQKFERTSEKDFSVITKFLSAGSFCHGSQNLLIGKMCTVDCTLNVPYAPFTLNRWRTAFEVPLILLDVHFLWELCLLSNSSLWTYLKIVCEYSRPRSGRAVIVWLSLWPLVMLLQIATANELSRNRSSKYWENRRIAKVCELFSWFLVHRRLLSNRFVVCLYEDGHIHLVPSVDLSIHTLYPQFSAFDAGAYDGKQFLETGLKIRLRWDNWYKMMQSSYQTSGPWSYQNERIVWQPQKSANKWNLPYRGLVYRSKAITGADKCAFF